jgi:hypothetical protein
MLCPNPQLIRHEMAGANATVDRVLQKISNEIGKLLALLML